MQTVLVQPRYPNDPLPEVMAGFNRVLSEALPECEVVGTVEEPHGHQVSPHEIILVWLPAIASTAASLAVITEKLRSWMKGRHEQDGGIRPRSIDLYGPDGHLLKRLAAKRGVDSNIDEVDGNASDAVRLPPKQR